MKICVTTSDNYHHILPVFFTLYNRYWGDPFDLVGYKKPDMELPENCTWVSLGKQRGPKFFSEDKREYFKQQPDYFVWLMEDTFLKGFDRIAFEIACNVLVGGKICLTNESMRREHTPYYERWNIGHTQGLFFVSQRAKYRLSTQPAIWSREYLLKYLKPGLSPWDFETQPQQNDGYVVWGYRENIVDHNEGVTRKDIHKLNLDGITL